MSLFEDTQTADYNKITECIETLHAELKKIDDKRARQLRIFLSKLSFDFELTPILKEDL